MRNLPTRNLINFSKISSQFCRSFGTNIFGSLPFKLVNDAKSKSAFGDEDSDN